MPITFVKSHFLTLGIIKSSLQLFVAQNITVANSVISVERDYIHVGFKYEERKKLMKELQQWPFHLVYVSNCSAQRNHCEPIYYSNYICHFVCIYNVRNEVFNHASKF